MREDTPMYTFPEDLKRAYESSPLSFVYYQNIDGRAVPVLASDGFCRNAGMDRGAVLDWLRIGMFERMHPDDVGVVSRISDDFLHQRGPYDVVFRCRIGDDYQLIHGLGGWQTMPGGGYATIAIDLPKNWDKLMEELGYKPLTEFFLRN